MTEEERYQGQDEEQRESGAPGSVAARAVKDLVAASPAEHGRVVVVSPPGCGEPIARRFLESIGLSPWAEAGPAALSSAPDAHEVAKRLTTLPEGTYACGPFPFEAGLARALRDAGVPVAVLYRDPRDAACSAARALLGRGAAADGTAGSGPLTLDEAIDRVLDGEGDSLSFDRRFDACRDWLEADGVLALRFEDVAGPRYGGCETTQIEHLIALAVHAEWRGPIRQLAQALVDSYGVGTRSPTEWEIGSWQVALSPSARRRLEEQTRPLVVAWGYDERPGPPPVPRIQGPIGMLLAALQREHGQVLHDRVQAVELESQERLATLRSLNARLKQRPVYLAERMLLRYERLRSRIFAAGGRPGAS